MNQNVQGGDQRTFRSIDQKIYLESVNSSLIPSIMVRWTLVQEQSMKYYSTIYVVRMSAIDTKEKKRQRKQWKRIYWMDIS